MLKLVMIGLLAGLFFSTTFILNRAMSLEGGHWLWSACLRYVYMTLILTVALPVFQGPQTTRQLACLFRQHWKFWIAAGSVGFGCFYALICYSADHSPGWVVATTWQLTIIASLFVLLGFGRAFPRKIWLFSGIVFGGVLCVNLGQAATIDMKRLALGGFPVLIAAFCYPLGNQLVWEAVKGGQGLPRIAAPCLDNPFNKVLLLSMGSLPFWGVLVLLYRPPWPSAGQLLNTALIAIFSGICATSLFLLARSRARSASQVAAVDATQASEVVFALLGEVFFLNAPWPNLWAFIGMGIVLGGLILFIRFQEHVK
jgi:drug/metabolite transporter (DMT)-like permease